MEIVKQYLQDSIDLLCRVSPDAIRSIAQLVSKARRENKQLFIIGNGGSAATASHLACDLQKGLPGFRVFALADNIPIMTAWANDDNYKNVFKRQLACLMNPGDLLVAISGSGNSTNILNAVEYAHESQGITVGLTGGNGGELLPLVDYNIVVQSQDMQHIEDMHSIIAHLIYRYCSTFDFQIIEEEKHCQQ